VLTVSNFIPESSYRRTVDVCIGEIYKGDGTLSVNMCSKRINCVVKRYLQIAAAVSRVAEADIVIGVPGGKIPEERDDTAAH